MSMSMSIIQNYDFSPGNFTMRKRFARTWIRTEESDQLPHVDEEGEQVISHVQQTLLDASVQVFSDNNLGWIK